LVQYNWGHFTQGSKIEQGGFLGSIVDFTGKIQKNVGAFWFWEMA
jgi:hypothetical protein